MPSSPTDVFVCIYTYVRMFLVADFVRMCVCFDCVVQVCFCTPSFLPKLKTAARQLGPKVLMAREPYRGCDD